MDGNKASSSKLPTTPNKSQERDDGHYDTPKKIKLDYDFWNQKPKDVDDNKKLDTRDCDFVADLTPGTNLGKSVTIRVTMKSEKKKRAIGNVFEFHGLDKSGEIGFVSYDATTSSFFEMIKVDGLYRIVNFSVKPEDAKYPTGAGLQNIIVLTKTTSIIEIDDDGSIPKIPFQFEKLSDLTSKAAKDKMDAIGVIVEIEDVESTIAGYTKRDLAITDDSKATVLVTVWGTNAEQIIAQRFDVLAIRKASVSEYQGIKSFNARNDTLLWVNPPLNETSEMRDWFQSELNKRDTLITSQDDQ